MIGTNANRPGSGKISQWNITPSQMAKNTVNPIRQIVDGMTITPNPNKELIRLTIGLCPSPSLRLLLYRDSNPMIV